jgi:prepilin-type N-terminal cleavage/methylation domain-containing protein
MRLSDREQGFTLFELLFVISIISLIATLSVPLVLDSRKEVNESSAIASLKAIHAAQNIFRERDYDHNGVHDFATEGRQLAGLIGDERFWESGHDGYYFVIIESEVPAPEFTWGAIAVPLVPGRTGNFLYSIDQTGRMTRTHWATDPGPGPEPVIEDFAGEPTI